MALRNKLDLAPLAISAAVTIIGYAIYAQNPFLLCPERKYVGCLFGSNIAHLLGEPLLLYSFALIPLSFAYLFLRKARLPLLIFALAWIPLSILLIAITPITSNTGMPLYFIGRETITWIMAGLFTFISLLIIALSFFRKK
jgi:hypothetical protein